jgi:cholesterol oxidase
MTAHPMTAATRVDTQLCFTEVMEGFIALDVADPAIGVAEGRQLRQQLRFRLTITIDDMAAFTADPQHEARAEGHVECDVLGGRLPVMAGWFNLFSPDTDPKRRWMRYRLHLCDPGGNQLTLVGVKDIHHDRGFDLWRDTSTLYTRILTGHTTPAGEDTGQPIAAGVLVIRPSALVKQLTTFRVAAPPGASRARALTAFGRLFLRNLWNVYGTTLGRGGAA